jgi:hypothetical protein
MQRTGDLSLTKWSSVPGEFAPILALSSVRAETTYLRMARTGVLSAVTPRWLIDAGMGYRPPGVAH